MNVQSWQLVAWLVAMLTFIVGLYILLLNAWHTANRHISALLTLIAINILGVGLFMGAANAIEAGLPADIQSATSPAVQVALLIAAIALLKPDRPRRWQQWVMGLLYALFVLPIVLTLMDNWLGTRLWHTFTDIAAAYPGGFVTTPTFSAGSLARFIRAYSYVMPTATIIFLLYVAVLNRQSPRATRRLAWLLLAAEVLASGLQFGLSRVLAPGASAVLSGACFAFAYGYAGFQQMVSERRAQRGRLQPRLTAIVAAITIPLLIGIMLLVFDNARQLLEQEATDRLHSTHTAVSNTAKTWLDLNIRALTQMANQPDIVSMNPAQQLPVLKATNQAYQFMYLVSTIDLNGKNVARSDGGELSNYGDQQWFRTTRNGNPVVIETLVSRTGNRPAVVLATPIHDSSKRVIGVAMCEIDLISIAVNLQDVSVGAGGAVYIVDATNKIVAHTDPLVINQLTDASNYPPVRALRQGTHGAIAFTDADNRVWRADIDEIAHGWGIVVQLPQDVLLAGLTSLQRLALGTVIAGVLVLTGMVALSLRQALQPVSTLTETAVAIAAGDLTRTAPVESEDELGTLAQSFNSMTGQLRQLIGGLELRVNERTADLERRSQYLHGSTEVGRVAASILDADQLVQQVVHVILERFDLYYVGLFLVDESGQWAVLRGGTGDAGKAMLARGHRLEVGGHSMVGWSIANTQARIAQVAAQDAVRLASPELPDTRAEAALPLRSRGRVLGALTVQSTRPGAFDEASLAVLQIMADQVATALDNARLYAESQAALAAARAAYGEISRQGWVRLLHARRDLGYRSDAQGTTEATQLWRPEMEEAIRTGQAAHGQSGNGQGHRPLAVPLNVRGNVIGVLDTFKPGEQGEWTADEIQVLQTVADQIAQTLEGARLYQDTQRRAAQEQLTSAITARMRESLDMERVLQTAAQEIGERLGLHDIAIQLETQDQAN
jgi:GAF domain-containing protein/HAMP domain-containing protein